MSPACPECGSPLAPDQRYCVSCGARLRPEAPQPAPLGEAPAPASARRILALRIAGRSGLVRLPSGRMTAALAVGMLASGILIGVAVGPVAIGTSAAAAARKIVALVTGPPSPGAVSTTASSSGDTGGQAGSSLPDSLIGPTSSPPVTPAPPPAAPAPTASSGAAAAAPAAGGSTTAASATTSSPTTAAPAPIPKLNRQGVVVALDSASQSFDLVDSRHRLFEVHSSDIPGVGAKLRLATRSLVNGTLAAARTVKVKVLPATSVTADGVVSFVDSADGCYTLSVRGVSLLVDAASPSPATPPPGDQPSTPGAVATSCPGTRTAETTPAGAAPTTPAPSPPPATPAPSPPPATPAPSATPAPGPTITPLPSVGQRLEAVLALPKPGAADATGALREIRRSLLGHPPASVPGTAKRPLELAGVLTAFDRRNRTATMSADGAGMAGSSITLSVPATIKLDRLTLPGAVVAHADFIAGSYKLTGLAGDSDALAAAAGNQEMGDFAAHARSVRAHTTSTASTSRSQPSGAEAFHRSAIFSSCSSSAIVCAASTW